METTTYLHLKIKKYIIHCSCCELQLWKMVWRSTFYRPGGVINYRDYSVLVQYIGISVQLTYISVTCLDYLTFIGLQSAYDRRGVGH